MRQIIPWMFALLLFAGCGKDIVFGREPVDDPEEELGPEYTTRPQIGTVTFSPTAPVDRDAVTVRTTITSPYGLWFVQIICQLDGEEETTIVGKQQFKDLSLTTYEYEGVIPGQRTGSVVKFLVFARSYYGVGMASDVMQYVVGRDRTEE